MNPMFADEPKEKQKPTNKDGFVLERQKQKRINPDDAAVDMIRQKIDALYNEEPDAKTEIKEVTQQVKPAHRSRHQQFMYDLSQSGKPLAQIQQAWHDYYNQLSDEDKHEVWQEFYAANKHQQTAYSQAAQQVNAPKHELPAMPKSMPAAQYQPPKPHAIAHHEPYHPVKKHMGNKRQALTNAKHKVLNQVKAQGKTQEKARQHLRSLAFGLGFGGLAILIVLFGLFNEVVIARLIQPSSGASETPIILTSDSITATDKPQVIIPKINVQLQLVFGVNSISEEIIQDSLDSGIVHYPGTAQPGQKGNGAYFGHSSNNIFNSGKYKFAFVLLKELVPGDIFYITYKGTVYTYRVYDKRIVAPDETWILGNAPGKIATATLITCDPPGTTINRLAVWGEQITPDPTTNATAPTPKPTAPELPAQGPTLWGRFWNWITGND